MSRRYDQSTTTFSPEGRLHQVEYAIEAVNQGTVCLGLRSNKYVVLAALKRSPNELASHQKKIQKIDSHMGISMSGLTADGRSLVKYMRTEALNHKYVYGSAIQGNRLMLDVADMHQRCTQSYVRRPYGVGLLVASYDQTGPHLFVTEPSGNYYEYYAMAIGSRSQTSRTYLEKEFETFANCSADDLIKHALKSLASSLSGDMELDNKSVSVAIVGENRSFELIEGQDLQKYLDLVEVEGAGQAGDGDRDDNGEAVVENPEV